MHLSRTPDGRLTAHVGDRDVVVQLRMCFPWSEPSRFISLRDDEDEEVGLVEDPSSLDAASRQALDLALAESGFVLLVRQILSVEEEVEIRQWAVETEHGRRTFQTHLDDWPRELPGGDLLIRDVAGDLYRLVRPDAMDSESKSLLWAFVD
jgi:hypothetical protein